MPLLASARRPLVALTALVLAFGVGAAVDWYRAEPSRALRSATYVGRDRCITCHTAEANAFAGSDHDRAMELATEESVLGDFNDVTFERLGERTRFFRAGRKFMVNAEGPDGENHDYEVKWTFGVRPLQQYMVEFPDGRVQVLRVSWDVARKKWFYVPPPDARDERLRHDDPLHWTGLAQNWNTMCAECHSTDYHKNYDLATNTYHSTFKEIDVSCEACHGPGSLHVELAEGRSLFWDRNVGYGLTNSLKNAANFRQVDTCAPCHSRRTVIHGDYRAGDAFASGFEPTLLYNTLYHADGQIRDEVYEFGSFTQSKMYHKGVKCSDCHDPHSLKLKYDGNRLCAQCHQPGVYDGARHHRHPNSAPNSAEQQCVTCHMPATNYMEIDPRRDHSIRVPRPDLTLELGTPNACNQCHEDNEKTAAAIVSWFGPKRPDDPHYAAAFAAGNQARPEGERLLRDVVERPTTPDIVRATAVSLLGNYPSMASARARREALKDPSPLVRAAAVRTLATESPADLLRLTLPLLDDPVRMVKFAAAARLSVAAPELANSQFRGEFEEALKEYREALLLNLDRADAHLTLATIAEQMGKPGDAIESFRNAMKVEPYRAGPRRELARLLDQARLDPALAALRQRVEPDPDEIRRLRAQEVDLLTRDAELLPGDPRPHYDRGMLLYLLDRVDDAREAFEEACRLAPDDYGAWMALALVCEQQQRWDDAGRALKQMQRLRPEAEEWKGLLQRMAETVRKLEAEAAAQTPHGESLSPEQAEGVADGPEPGEN